MHTPTLPDNHFVGNPSRIIQLTAVELSLSHSRNRTALRRFLKIPCQNAADRRQARRRPITRGANSEQHVLRPVTRKTPDIRSARSRQSPRNRTPRRNHLGRGLTRLSLGVK